jgi:NADH dehydrogenase
LSVARVLAVDVNRRRVATSRGDITYDYLVLALGAVTNSYGVPGAQEYSFALKTLTDARRLKNHVVDQFEAALHQADAAQRQRRLRFVVVGGGPTGVEVAAELADLCFSTARHLYPGARIGEEAEIVLIEGNSRLLSQMPEQMGQVSLAALRAKGVRVRLGTRAASVQADGVTLEDGEKVEAMTTIWVAGITPAPLLFSGAVPRDEAGRIEVGSTLQVAGQPRVFSLGDMARFVDEATGQVAQAQAQVASKQARVVAHNIAALLDEGALKRYRYRRTGELVSLGRWFATGRVHRIFFSGKLAWWLWRSVYLTKMLSWRKKLKVMIDWTWDLFVPRDISQLP